MCLLPGDIITSEETNHREKGNRYFTFPFAVTANLSDCPLVHSVTSKHDKISFPDILPGDPLPYIDSLLNLLTEIRRAERTNTLAAYPSPRAHCHRFLGFL